MEKKWIVKNKSKSAAKKLDLEKIKKILFKNRNLKTQEQIKNFLNSPDPYLISLKELGIAKPEINKVLKLIKEAIKHKQPIIIYGDYDADGICATAILWETLYGLGAKAMPFIPHRKKHGYGLNKKGINEIIKSPEFKIKNSQPLLITVDNGIVAREGIVYAQKQGFKVIITDHHQRPDKLAPAQGFIWSDKICGAGVAWFLAKEIHLQFHKNLQKFKDSNSLELACIGTVTDLMPVLDINRSLIKYGLKELRQSQRLGIKALCSQAGISQEKISTYEIGYIIGPRLNAMGRLENALESLRFLCTNKKERAQSLAAKLGAVNFRRQQLTQEAFKKAKQASEKEAKKFKIIIISHQNYNPGIIGLIAGKITEEFYRPTLIISEAKEFSKGSARSISGFNMIKNLKKINIFEDLGGHPMAAGFTIKTNKIKELRKKLSTLAAKELKDEDLQPRIKIDLEIGLEQINWQLEKEIEKFAPFGIANPKPVFLARQVKIVNKRTVGREQKHLKLSFSPKNKDNYLIEAIAFQQGFLAEKLSLKKNVDICFSLEKNVWQGRESLQLIIKDFKII